MWNTTAMPEDWNFYICNVNDVVASIFINLDLRKSAPDRSKPNLLWVWVYMKWPRDDGLSSSDEFDTLKAIEEKLSETLAQKLDALFCGRITTDSRREFYYYAPRSEQLEPAIQYAISHFRDYEFDCGSKEDPGWTQYLNVLYPSDEDRQRIENRKVLDVLEEKGDRLKTPRDVWHWIYFSTKNDREEFRSAALRLEYRIQSESETDRSGFPYGICIARFQSVMPSELDDAIIELFRLARKYRGDYDGWETQVISQ